MPNNAPQVNETTAPLTNVRLCYELMDRVVRREAHLPGMAVFYGHSGWGKTVAAILGAQKFKAHYVEVGDSWTKKTFLQKVLHAVGKPTRGTIADLVDAVIFELGVEQTPLIIDEFDFVVDKKYLETVREIHDKSGAPIILIGEELLPSKIAAQSERFHNRVLDWVAAQPANERDTAHLAKLYCRDVTIAPDLLDAIHTRCEGRIRRICVNLDKVVEVSRLNGLDTVSLADWGDRKFFTGVAPARRPR